MAIENHSVELAYATKDNIVLPAYVPDATRDDMELTALLDLADIANLNTDSPIDNLLVAAIADVAALVVLSDAADVAIQADGNSDAGTKADSTATKAAIDALPAFVAAITDIATGMAAVFAAAAASAAYTTSDAAVLADNCAAPTDAASAAIAAPLLTAYSSIVGVAGQHVAGPPSDIWNILKAAV